MLLAARDEGTIGLTAGALLDVHLRECVECQAVAATVPPTPERRNHSSLPPVSTEAYALGREVARGGMGRILEAQDMRIGRPVAVKELLGKTASLSARFEREARVTARLQHPGVVPIYEIGKWPDGTPFYTMRMIEGRTLREAIRGRRALEQRLELLPGVIAAAEAVAFAHGKRIIHRDLTPNNILVGEYGDTVVIDWGLAKDLASPSPDDEASGGPYRDEAAPAGAHLTSVGAVIGTAAYMPPEQASGSKVDERADVYALGAILYHVLVGDPPYRAGKSEDVVRQVQAGPPRPIAEAAPGAPRDLASIVEKAMARSAVDRYPTATELVAELRRFQTGRMVEAHAYSFSDRARRWLRAHRPAVLATTTALIGLVVAGAFGLSGVLRERDRAETARAKAESENVLLVEEQGRQELTAGNTTRALAWLIEAYKLGDTSPELRFLLGTAMHRVESIVHTEECGGQVQSVEFSPDGVHVMAACQFGIGVARIADWAIELKLDTHADGALYSNGGRLIASWEYKRLTLWDAATGTHLLGPLETGDRIRTVHFTPDDRILVTTSDDAMVRTWDVATGRILHEMNARSGEMNVVRAEVTPDGQTIVSVTSDGTFQKWNVLTGEHLGTFKIPAQPIASDRLLSPDGRRVFTCAADGSVWILDLATGRTDTKFFAHSNVAFDCSFSKDGREIATGGMDGIANVWNAATGQLISTLHHGGLWMRVALSPDGERVATMGSDGALKLWHAASGTLLSSLDDPFGRPEVLVFSPDGHFVIATRQPSTILVIKDFDAGLRSITLPERSTVEAANTDLTRLAVQSDGAVKLVDASTLVPLRHEPIEAPFVFSRDSKRFAGTVQGGVLVMDATTGRPLARIATTSKPDMIALDDKGGRLLVVGADASVWNVDAGTLALHLDKRSDKDCLSPAGDAIVAWTDPHIIEVWSIDRRQLLSTIHLQRDTLGPVGFDATGRRVILTEKEDPTGLTASTGALLSIHDISTGALIADVGRSVFSTLSSDRRFLVTSALDGKLSIRDASTGKTLSAMASGSRWVAAQALLGGRFVASEDFGILGIRSARDGRLLASLRQTFVFHLTQDSFQAGNPDVVIRSDDGALLQLGSHPVLWTLPREDRSLEEVERIARKHIRWRVVDGRLLPVTAALHGRILRNGQPVAHADVAIEAGDGWMHAISGPDGRFEVPSLPDGHYGVIAFNPEHTAKGMHDAIIASDDLTADYELNEAATISGRVVDEHGQPVSGVEIMAGLGDGALRASTDDHGRYTIRALGAQTFELHVVLMKNGQPTGFQMADDKKVSVTIKSNTDALTASDIVVRRATP